MAKLFPPYLNARSSGTAVVALQSFLLGWGRNERGSSAEGLIPDGDYGDRTIHAVKQLQGAVGVERDGHFGPGTRKAVAQLLHVDFDAIELDDTDIGCTLWVSPDGEENVWPEGALDVDEEDLDPWEDED